VRVGSRQRWFLCGHVCGYAWVQDGRTSGVFGIYYYTERSDAAVERDERLLISRLRHL
jgi:hypothetical protein